MPRPYSGSDHDFAEDYYRHDCGPPYQRDDFWLAFFARIADAIVSRIHPHRVLDAGCAMGLLVEALRERGVEAYGFDLSSYAIDRVPPQVRSFCWQASITEEIAGTYDLIVCQEVLAHLPVADAERAVANFCRHTDDVLFSLSPYGPAPRHANLEPPEHWAGVFAGNAFYRDFDFDATFVTPWAVRYRRRLYEPDTLVRRYEERVARLRLERDHAAAGRQFAEETMQNMERSWFWKARGRWQRLRALVGIKH